VTSRVDRDRVIAQRRHAGPELVEHPTVVEPTVEQQHDRLGWIAPLPDAQPCLVDRDEERPLRFDDQRY
jgi:hypothetical protein